MSEPKHDAGDQHAGMVVVASLVEARADGTKVLESVDASFDYVASLVCLCIAGRRATSTRSFGQARLASILAFGADHADPTSAQRLTILPCPVGPIEPQTRRWLSRGTTEPLRNVDGIEHRFHLRGVVALACGDHDREGAHLTVDAEVDLGRALSARVADPLVRQRPLFSALAGAFRAPAEARCALMCVASSAAPSQSMSPRASASACNAWRMRCHVPSRPQ